MNIVRAKNNLDFGVKLTPGKRGQGAKKMRLDLPAILIFFFFFFWCFMWKAIWEMCTDISLHLMPITRLDPHFQMHNIVIFALLTNFVYAFK